MEKNTTNNNLAFVGADYSKILSIYHDATRLLCVAFYEKYYWDKEDGAYHPHEDDFYMIGDMKSQGIDTVGIGDQFWYITDIQTALINGMEREIIWKWYYKYRDIETPQQYVNLWHFWLKEKGKPMYSPEEIAESEKKVQSAQETFNKELEKYNPGK